MIEKAIGKRIQEARKKKGLTQEKLAELIDVTPHFLSALERGIYNIKLDTLVQIINHLDCTADDIFCDVINNGYKARSSRLSDKIETLSSEEQARIFDVVDAMIKNAK
ncbi:MAG: helix-turn-helix transcriptional regulator [Clostridia bacterium]|nr:helix-turn-helix transcriptional regulator [Clostridia bacterium]